MSRAGTFFGGCRLVEMRKEEICCLARLVCEQGRHLVETRKEEIILL